MATVAVEQTTSEASEANKATGHGRYRVSVAEYRSFAREGYLIVRGLVPPEDVAAFIAHTDDVLAGREPLPGAPHVIPGWSAEEAEKAFNRTFMPHLHHPLHERFLLHERVLDVLEALIGPDVMAMQSMLFLKSPGSPGQGYHQDAYYIPTRPDTLCGAWIALDPADEENGCLWMTRGSQFEPVYPDTQKIGQNHAPDALDGLTLIHGASDPDETANGLTPIAAQFAGQEVPAIVEPGDVVFFQGHILHRSHHNASTNRYRRSFVGHYANARSYTEWHGGNGEHILARGDTHLPFATPRFGTPCAALRTPEERAASAVRMPVADGDMMGSEEMGDAQRGPTAH